MTKRALVPGAHVFVFPDGDAFTVPTAGTCGREVKPGATDAGWVDLGIIETSDIERSETDLDIFAPSPGRLRHYDVLETKDKLKIKFETKELSPYTVEVALKTLRLTSASTQFNPLEGTEKKAWIKVQSYDQADALWVTLDVYCRLKITGGMGLGGAEVSTAKFEADVLFSSLNTGTL